MKRPVTDDLILDVLPADRLHAIDFRDLFRAVARVHPAGYLELAELGIATSEALAALVTAGRAVCIPPDEDYQSARYCLPQAWEEPDDARVWRERSEALAEVARLTAERDEALALLRRTPNPYDYGDSELRGRCTDHHAQVAAFLARVEGEGGDCE